ncbi:MAG: B12-binding domain-containing radical SAM protein [Bryobacterales bacterium]|nr:B12-binding domain-containing radical SAM protein [Bryobacterales bacterium]
MRVLLIQPPSPERLGAPLLGLQYVIAALLEEGCEVRVIDGAARGFSRDAEWIAREAREFAPQVIGVSLFTRWVWHAYQLVELLRGGDWVMVAGGAHATVRAEETLRRGFDVALTGEAEWSVRRLVRWVDGHDDIGEVPGAVFRRGDGSVGYGPPAQFVDDLDGLPMPHVAQPLFDARWYGDGAAVVPGGVLTSRGCPARCTFCANHVTGRRFRHRSAENVVQELNAWHRESGLTHFPFWDDAFTAEPARLVSLCEALRNGLEFPLSFGAITRANMVTPALLRLMRQAGLMHVNFGVESGDDAILKAIRKGVRTEQVVRALEWAKSEGLVTACNFMLGFPQETEVELERTLRFMERIAPMVDAFSTMGVVVPFPGTPIYDEYHFPYGFTDWWLQERYSRYMAAPPMEDAEAFHRYYIDDGNLQLDFFRYSRGVREMIGQCLRYKAEHNLRRMRAA